MRFFGAAVLMMGLFIGSAVYGEKQVYKRLFEQTDREVNGIRFSEKRDIVNGKVTREWRVADQVVTKEAYIDALTKALADEVKKEAAANEAATVAEAQFWSSARELAVAKLLSGVVASWEQELEKVNAYNLDQFFSFSADSIKSRSAYERLITSVLPEAKAMIEQGGAKDVDEAERLADALEQDLPALKKMVRDAIKEAINHSTDTKKLKALLQLGVPA